MLNQKKFFGPSMVIQDINTIYKFCLLSIIIYIFLSLFMSSFNHDDLRKTCYILLINSFVLTLVGVYQKINYNFEPYVKEILVFGTHQNPDITFQLLPTRIIGLPLQYCQYL